MIFTLQNADPRVRTQLQSFTRILPVPQFLAWENAAAQFIKKGFRLEAAMLIDLAMRHYGKDVGRASFERLFGTPMSLVGRGFSSLCGFAFHPGIYALRDHAAPCRIGTSVAVRAGSNLLIANPWPQDAFLVCPFSPTPQDYYQYPGPCDGPAIRYIGIGDWVVYSRGTDTVTCVELSNCRHAGGDPRPLRFATLRFDTTVHGLCGPLEDGTFFVTTASEIPVLSDVCHLCRIDFDKILGAFGDAMSVDIREIGALEKDVVLPNIEQSLDGDCIAAGTAFMTCGGGMQNTEVRFIETDGSWTTRFAHEHPVIRVMHSDQGPVSLDKRGLAVLWNDGKAVAEWQFDFAKMPQIFADNLDDTDFSIDWRHRRLYMTVTIPPQSTLRAALIASHSCRLDEDGPREDEYVKKLFHVGGVTVAMLADASYHFWNLDHDCVEPGWQMSKSCAEQKDWQQLLDGDSPAIEQDPRIRITDVDMPRQWKP